MADRHSLSAWIHSAAAIKVLLPEEWHVIRAVNIKRWQKTLCRKARAKYQDFLTLWKDADPDIPILKQAKAEYAKLR
jgi:hypothetical protein